MRKSMIVAALVCSAASTPALARDGSAYVGLDAGLLKPSSLKLRFTNATISVPDAERLKHKVGYDVDAVFGYDFGMFRAEGELGYKHAGFKSAVLDATVVRTTNGGVQSNPNYDASGRDNVLSLMANGLLDIGSADGPSGSIGVGVGEARANVRAGLVPSNALNFSGEDRSFAWQILAEARYPVSSQVDIGLKYRYFQASDFNFGPFCSISCGATLSYRLKGKYRSNSLLASLVYNFAGAAPPPAPPPPPPAPPPPPPAPATQTCPDGSVIPATSTCPPPPAPPPPPPAPERG
jgi:OmpA-OmpF porin, OOP family